MFVIHHNCSFSSLQFGAVGQLGLIAWSRAQGVSKTKDECVWSRLASAQCRVPTAEEDRVATYLRQKTEHALWPLQVSNESGFASFQAVKALVNYLGTTELLL